MRHHVTERLERLRQALADRYAIDREIGRGGMATVYLADDPKHGRQVALKVLNPDLSAAVGKGRFLREIQVTAGLHHPHILTLLDSGQADDSLFYVMPYVEGESLREKLLRERQLGLDEALRITCEVADALGYAHGRGIVHRDIKPENILLTSGHAMVADFGIARAVGSSAGDSITSTGIALGTPLYMSPEQASGEEADGRSDLYALGCVFYEMLAGEVPFKGPTALAILARKSSEPAPRLSMIRAAVPAHIEDAIGRTLARVPADRFATSQMFVDALQSASGSYQRWSVATAPPREAEASVVVLPFTCLSSREDDEYLSDGLSEEIIHALARVAGLRVVARTSAFALKGERHDVRAIGERLNVSRIVEGSLRRAGNRIRVTAQLVNVEDGFELWSERYDRQVDDVFAIQDEIAAAIVDRLRGLLATGAGDLGTAVRPPKTFAAYELYLKGRYLWNRRTAEGLRRSIELMQEALAADPEFALAHAGLADAYATMGLYGLARPADIMPPAQQAATAALALQDRLAQALTARACVAATYAWDWEAAEQDFTRAVAADPSYPTASQWFAMNLLTPLGRFAEAREHLERARALDPLSLTVRASFAALHYYERDYDAALAASSDTLELDEHFGLAHYFRGLAQVAAGDADDGVLALERAALLSDDRAEVRSALGYALAAAGRAEAARDVAASLRAEARDRYVSPVLTAMVALGLGDRDGAVELLDDARQQRATDLVWLGVRPQADGLRDDPRFIAMLEEMGLPPRPQ